MNKAILVGHLTHDPELRYTPQGRPVANLRVATNEYAGRDDAGNAREHVEYHTAVLWGSPAEAAAKHLVKGRQVLVEGPLRTRSWEDAETGQRRYRTEIAALRVEYLGTATGREPVRARQPAGVGADDTGPDDIPF
jgi:single-strand DNA-binding protein